MEKGEQWNTTVAPSLDSPVVRLHMTVPPQTEDLSRRLTQWWAQQKGETDDKNQGLGGANSR